MDYYLIAAFAILTVLFVRFFYFKGDKLEEEFQEHLSKGKGQKEEEKKEPEQKKGPSLKELKKMNKNKKAKKFKPQDNPSFHLYATGIKSF